MVAVAMGVSPQTIERWWQSNHPTLAHPDAQRATRNYLGLVSRAVITEMQPVGDKHMAVA